MTDAVVHHVALNCRDPIAVERFHTRNFGFSRARVVPIPDSQIVFLRRGDMYLELFQSEGDAQPPPPVDDGPHTVGIRHLAFMVDDVDVTLAAIGDDATTTLGPLDFDDVIPGWRTAWIADPDGRIVEISQGYVDEDNPPALPSS